MWLIMMILLSIIALTFILYLAMSKKSSPIVRRLAILALILAAIALIVSAVFIVAASPQEAEPGPVTLPLPVKPVAPVQKVYWQELLIFSVLFLLFLLFLLALSRGRNNPPKAGKDGALPEKKAEKKRFQISCR
jgi:cytochrome bd-type quinol oxidase subunit 2